MLAPSPQITELLDSIGLGNAIRLRRAARYVRLLGRQLPQFESIWIDALAQYGMITRWQAGEINAGRGTQLKLGPYVVTDPLPECLYASGFRARHVDTGERVGVVVAERSGRAASEVAGRLRELVATVGGLTTEYCALPIAAGQVEQDSTPTASLTGRLEPCRPAGAFRLWIAAPWIPSRSAADWLTSHGRMPAAAVLEIARAMAAGLAALETAGLCHGDIGVSSVWLATDGRVVLPLPGVRGILRPEEGHARADLLPEAFDYLAPERVARGTAPNMASDLYACGCVWWHLLCGRAPLGGGDSQAKLRAAHEAHIPDPRELAPETPAPLAEAILACTRPEPGHRPPGAAELAALLGSPTRAGRRGLCRALRAAEIPGLGWPSMRTPAAPHGPRQLGQMAAMGLALAAAVLVAAWPIWRAVGEKEDLARAPQQDTLQAANTTPAVDPGTNPQPPAAARASEPIGDRVLPAAYLAETEPRGSVAPATDAGSSARNAVAPSDTDRHDFLVNDGQLDNVQRLTLRPGHRVVGQEGARRQVRVPATGLHVTVEADPTGAQEPVCFEGIDFFWDHRSSGSAALVSLMAENVQFQNCTFQVRGAPVTPPDAVRWVQPASSQTGALALPSGSIRFVDCLFRDVSAALDSEARGAVRAEFLNVLHLGPGPLVQSAAPSADESTHLVLEQVTLRGAAALWRCRVTGSSAQAGRIFVRGESSVFAPVEGGSLVLFHGESSPTTLLHNLTWEGEGALVTPGIHVAAREQPGGVPQRLDDSHIAIAGLVLSEVEFAGPAGGVPDNSRLLRWNAPLRTADPPGANLDRLPGQTPSHLGPQRR